MFIRENKNRSESVSVQVTNKSSGRFRVVKTVGCATQRHETDRLRIVANQDIKRLQAQPELFKSEHDELIEGAISSLSKSTIVGYSLVLSYLLTNP